MLRLLRGDAIANSFVLGSAMMQVNRRARVKTDVRHEGDKTVLRAEIAMRLVLAAGAMEGTAGDLAAQVERSAAAVISKLQAMGSDAVGFGKKAVRRYKDIPSWEASGWENAYRHAEIEAIAQISVH